MPEQQLAPTGGKSSRIRVLFGRIPSDLHRHRRMADQSRPENCIINRDLVALVNCAGIVVLMARTYPDARTTARSASIFF
jgi:predicted component of type VI protein secretion system